MSRRARSRSPVAGPSSRRTPSPTESTDLPGATAQFSASGPNPFERTSMPSAISKCSDIFKDFLSFTDVVLATHSTYYSPDPNPLNPDRGLVSGG